MKSLTNMAVAAGLMFAGFGVVGAGCVSSETTPPQEPPPPYPTVADFCAKLAEFVCNEEVVGACYNSNDASLEADTASCVSAFMGSSRCNPGVPYHHPGAEACLLAWQEVYAEAEVSAETMAEAEETCLEAFYDELGILNTECVYDHECDVLSDLRCVVKAGDTSGTCQVLDRVGGGFDCGGIDQLCLSGFYCDPDAGACLARKGAGEACSSQVLCRETARCDLPVDGTCIAKYPNNDACFEDDECSGGLCNKPSGAAEGQCASTIRLYQTGAVCDDFQ